MKQQIIYEVRIETLEVVGVKWELKPELTYFSNLKKTIETIKSVLALRGWDANSINYTAVYRSLKLKGRYLLFLKFRGVNYIQLAITSRILNPSISTLGIDERPSEPRK